jgi:uncharacterized membrane protein
MMCIETSILINRPIDEVFSYATSSAHAFIWRSTLVAITDTPHETMRVGSIFREQSKLLSQIVETTYEVVEWMPPRRFTYKSIVGAAPGLVGLRFAPVTGGTQVSIRVEESFDLVFPHDEQLAVRAVQRTLQADLQTLREVMEDR